MPLRNRQASLVAVVAVAWVVVFGGMALAQAGDTSVGTWQMNIAKSKGSLNKSSTIKIEAAGAGVTVTVDQVSSDGTVRHYESTSDYDGKDRPVVGNSTNGDMVARTRTNSNTTKSVYKKGGKLTVTNTTVVSSDGRTMTITQTGTNALGQAVNSVTVYDKQ